MGSENSRTRLSQRTPGEKSPNTVQKWECPYCKGLGIDPHNPTGIRHCPACCGYIFWESDIENLERCDVCNGSGQVNKSGKWQVCHQCHGAGKV